LKKKKKKNEPMIGEMLRISQMLEEEDHDQGNVEDFINA
jgi:hypothetical protein